MQPDRFDHAKIVVNGEEIFLWGPEDRASFDPLLVDTNALTAWVIAHPPTDLVDSDEPEVA